MEEVLVLVFSNLRHDARVARQVNWLSKRYVVFVVCFDGNEQPNIKLIKIRQTKLTAARKALLALTLVLRINKLAYRIFHDYNFLEQHLAGHKFSFIIANDIDTLPLAFQLKKQSKIIFDAHEYAPRHFENNTFWKFFFQPFYVALCRQYIPQTHAMLTVGKGLAHEYEINFGVKPVIITNATRYTSVTPSMVKPDKIRLIHHGIINPSRKLELMVEMMEYLDERFTLDMVLMTSDYASAKTKRYITSFKQYAATQPKIKILPAVESSQVVEVINQYDIGVFLIPPINFNYANTLPNKLFDFIQARLGIAVGPTPEMAAIVNEFRNGIVSEDFSPKNLAMKLNKLSGSDIETFKSNSSKAALSLNAEKNEEIFNDLINRIK